jgi:cobalt-zinc-cadmium efflux system protein
MTHDHSHANPGIATGRHPKRLVLVVVITATVVVGEVIGGLLSGSLALLADAGHMLTDSTGLLIALVATTLAARPATPARTFGLQRIEILAALTNGLLLVGVAVWVLVQAVDRWSNQADISSGLMLVVAVVGAVANAIGLLILRGGQKESLNLRGPT